MDIKRLITSVTAVLAVVVLWQLGLSYLYKLHPEWKPQSQAQTTPASATPQTTGNAPTSNATSQATTAASPTPGVNSISPAAATGYRALPGEAGVTALIGSAENANPKYAMQLETTGHGAALSSVTLNDFFATAERKSLFRFELPIDTIGADASPLASRSVTIDGTVVELAANAWTRSAGDETSSITYTAVVADGVVPVLEISKTYRVQPRDAADGNLGFEVAVSHRLRNLSAKTLNVSLSLNGPTSPPKESDRQDDRVLLAGYDDTEQTVALKETGLMELTAAKPEIDLVGVDKRPLLWVGMGSAYFNVIMRLEQPAGAPAAKLAKVTSRGINLADLPEKHAVAMLLVTSPVAVAPTSMVPLDFKVFFGPKQRALLDTAYYSRFPIAYNETLVYRSGFCGTYCTFSWLISALYGILWFFHAIFRDWGLAIICLVVLVRSILHPVTKKSQVNMMQMGKMGPEIERLKKKHGDNKEELNKAMMQVYKEQGMTPVLGCIPMFLQMPIWIALWSALQSTFELRQAGFLRFGWLHLTWINDLSRPDYLIHFSQPVPLIFSMTIQGINVLPILLAVVFFIQQQVQPAPANMTPEQEQQRKMMKWMSLLFPVFLYGGPSGLNLYILTSTTIGIFENKIIRAHIKARDEAEKAGKVVVSVKATRANRRNESGKESAKKTGIMGWLAELQQKAEEVRRNTDKRGDK